MRAHVAALAIGAIVAIAGCSGGSSGPAAPFVASSTPATAAPNSTGPTAIFRLSIPVGAAANAAASRKPAYVSTGTISVKIAITAVNGFAPTPALSTTVAISTCPIVSNDYVCVVSLPAPPGSDTFLFSASGGSPSVLISQQSVVKTVVAGPNDFTGSPVTLDANPATLTLTIAPPASGVTTVTPSSKFILHGSEPRTFSFTLTDAAGKTISGPGSPVVNFTTSSASIAITTNSAASTFTVSPTGSAQTAANSFVTFGATIAPANPATDLLSTTTIPSTTYSVSITYQLFAVTLASTTLQSSVALDVYGCPTPSTCTFVPSHQVTPGDGSGSIAESGGQPAFQAEFDASGDLIVCNGLNGSGPVQYFPASQLALQNPGSAANTWTSGINGIKSCDVPPSTNPAFAVQDGKGYNATPADIATQYLLAFSASTWQSGYVPPVTPSNSVNVPASVNELVASGTTLTSGTPALLAIGIEGPSNLACTPAGAAACGEIALVSPAGTGATCNNGNGVAVTCGVTYIGPLFNNSGAFLTAWDSANSRLIVACGTPDASGKYEVLAFPIDIAAGTAGAGTTIVNLSAKPARLAVSTSGEVAVVYQSSAATNEIDTYSPSNALIGSVTGITTSIRGLAFYDDATLVTITQTSTSSGSMSTYALTSTSPTATTSFSTGAPASVAVSFNL